MLKLGLRVVLLLVLVSCLAAPPARAADSWPWIMGAYSVGVAADAWTTHAALERGGVEMNPMYSWSGPDGVAPARLAVGLWVGYGLQKTHQRHPRLAKTLAVFAAITSLAVSRHNHDVARD